jgi:outer membrane receptor protein involved in Fe transport
VDAVQQGDDMKKTFAVFVLAVTVLIMPALGQLDTGSISGTVHDPSGALVPDATVTATNLSTQAKRTVQSGPQGGYTIVGLPAGNYELRISKQSFGEFRQTLEVTVGGRSTVDATLALSSASTTVEVVAAQAGTEVNTQTQELSQIITPQQLAQLPSLTRNPYDFVALSGNVSAGDRTSNSQVVPGGGGQNGGDRGVGYYVNGQRSSGTEILLDGVENADLFSTGVGQQIPQDAVQEFRVVSSNFEAQYGRASGGVVNVSTKSGSNGFHGSAWEYNRQAAFTANTYDNAAQQSAAIAAGQCSGPSDASCPGQKGQYRRNQFGYDVGGPILKNKLFFFQSTEWLRVRSNANLAALVPTPQFIALAAPNVQSYFSAYGTNAPAFGSVLTKENLAATNGLNLGPVFNSNVPAGTPVLGVVNFSAPTDAGGGNPGNQYQLVGRVDFNMTEQTQMFVRYGLQRINNFIGGDFASPYPEYNVGDHQTNNAVLYSLSHIFSPAFVSTTKLSFNRINAAQNYATASQNVPELILSNGATIAGLPVQMPGLWATFAGIGGEPYGGPQNIAQLNEDLAWTKGSHTMRFGGQFMYEQINRAYGAYAQGIELLGSNPGAGLDNFLTGNLLLFQAAVDPKGKFPCVRNPQTGLQITPNCEVTLPASSPSFARSYRYRDWAAYAQDSWRFSPRLTFNYGVRYEFYGVQHNNNQQLDSNFYRGSGSSFFERVRNGSVQLAPNSPVGGLWGHNYGTVAPRVGFAWDMLGNGSTSLRGGYGISYERNFGNVTFNVIQNPPNYASVQVTSGATVTAENLGPLGGTSGIVPLPPSSLRNVDESIRTAQTHFYSLALERQIFRNGIVAFEYTGARGAHLYDIKNIHMLGGGQVYLGDPLVFACGASGTAACWTRPNNQYAGINNRGSQGDSYYNGFNVRFQTQNLHGTGLSMVANYTWSHSIDDLSSTFSESSSSSDGVGNLGYLDPRNPGLDRGSSDFDIRHRIVISPIWEEPFFRGGKGVLGHVLGGWSIVPLFTARTGTPFSIMDSTNSLPGNAGVPSGIARYTPSSAISNFAVGSPVATGQPNNFDVLSLPAPTSIGQNYCDTAGHCALISDFGPFPANMSGRNVFRGPGAWNLDLAVGKNFRLTERVSLQFRAEGFNVLNHHNLYVNGFIADAANFSGVPVVMTAKKGGLGNAAVGGNHDERRFGQFALRVNF